MPLQVPKCENCGQSDAQVTCTTCEGNYCNLCDTKWHNEKRKNHQRIPYTGTELPSKLCTRIGHEGQHLSLYCQTCLIPICAFCLVAEHKNHPSVPLKNAVEHVKTIIKDNLIPFQDELSKIDQEIKVMEVEKKKLEEEVKKLDGKIKEAKNKRNETSQKLEDLKSWLDRKDVDPYRFLSLVSELKLNSKPQVATQGTTILDPVGVWLNKPVNTWKLLYKWTRDPKTNEAWHQACDNKGPTVTVIRTKDGHVFGGYSQISWSAPTNESFSWAVGIFEPKESRASFLFSLTDGKNRQPYQCLQFQIITMLSVYVNLIMVLDGDMMEMIFGFIQEVYEDVI